MKRKTLSIDSDVYRHLKRQQKAHETLSLTLRRILVEAETDPAHYLAELVENPPQVDVALLRRRQAHPLRSNRPTGGKRGCRAA